MDVSRRVFWTRMERDCSNCTATPVYKPAPTVGDAADGAAAGVHCTSMRTKWASICLQEARLELRAQLAVSTRRAPGAHPLLHEEVEDGWLVLVAPREQLCHGPKSLDQDVLKRSQVSVC